jgi:hypothetical protein
MTEARPLVKNAGEPSPSLAGQLEALENSGDIVSTPISSRGKIVIFINAEGNRG